ncbi:flagellar biosynthesis protein FlhA [Myxococcota bacterium]|nr:flagellar biosynthesis protein FlhA [Myxococcota bacterium]
MSPTKSSATGTLGAAAAVIGILSLTLLPLPAIMLDVLIALSLCIALLTFLVALYVEKPLDFSSFPSLLLLVTLFRLALNISTTRRILLHGGEGAEAAGGIIAAFGDFAIGGNFVVGAVVFLILVIVNFIVITKGAERISEVSARFTLDSMPGKQMAIDADLGAGLIDEKTAKDRRKAVEQEADFYGAMDGASKFVRGDAIAGILIVVVNIIGGIIIGVLQHDITIGDAMKTYMLLSIGDGMVSQIPALLVSTGAALLTTRSASAAELGTALGHQLLSRSRPLQIAAIAIGGMALIPGMPHLALFALSGGVYALSRRSPKLAAEEKAAAAEQKLGAGLEPKKADPASQKAELEAALPVDLLSLDVGLDILPLVDAARNGELLGRIASLRKQIALDLGLIVPPVHVQDDLRLRPGGYTVRISGVQIAHAEIRTGRLLAVHPLEQATASLSGELVREPTFGLPAKWISPADRTRAEASGCTVVDAATVIATHLTELVRRHAHELLGRKEAQELVDLAAKQNQKVVEELIPHLLSLGDVIKVLRALLREAISIRDMRSILEALADNAATVKDPAELVELVRQRLARQITRSFAGEAHELQAMVLDPMLEELFRHPGRGDIGALSRATSAIERAARDAAERDLAPVIVVAPDVRRAISQVALRHAPGLSVLSYRELDPSIPFITRGIVSSKEAA